MKHAFLACLLIAACGGHHGNGDDTTGDGDGGVDAPIILVDAPPFGGMCVPGGPQCSNCIDDDGDGKIDGFDPECTGAFDNDESSFATGIPGDNKDAINQDCFFDGDSGAGNDGCNQHVCCLLGATTKAECTQDLTGIVNNPQQEGNKYNVDACFPPLGTAQIPAKCVMVCEPLTPPGCDCFGCCTICEGPDCADVAINPVTSPNCTPDKIDDPVACPRCTKTTACEGSGCGGDTCVLCPGQGSGDLPPQCNGTSTCPTDATACPDGTGCPNETYCSNGCCIGVIQ